MNSINLLLVFEFFCASALTELVLCCADIRLILWGVADFRWSFFLQYDSNKFLINALKIKLNGAKVYKDFVCLSENTTTSSVTWSVTVVA